MIYLGAIKLKSFRLRRNATGRLDATQGRMTQAELAGLVDITPGMVSQMEKGLKQPSLQLAARLERIGVCDAADWTRPARCATCAKALGDDPCTRDGCPFAAWLPDAVEQAA